MRISVQPFWMAYSRSPCSRVVCAVARLRTSRPPVEPVLGADAQDDALHLALQPERVHPAGDGDVLVEVCA